MSTDFLRYLTIFDPNLLQDEVSLATALDVLEGTVDSETVQAIMTKALEVPHVFEFIISGAPLYSLRYWQPYIVILS